MAEDVNEVQDLQLQLIDLVEGNELSGKRVAADLKANRGLWLAAIMDSEKRSSAEPINLIKLRDLADAEWNVDTLFVLPAAGREDDIEALARTWKADEVEWIGGESACSMLGSYSPPERDNPRQVLRVWWD